MELGSPRQKGKRTKVGRRAAWRGGRRPPRAARRGAPDLTHRAAPPAALDRPACWSAASPGRTWRAASTCESPPPPPAGGLARLRSRRSRQLPASTPPRRLARPRPTSCPRPALCCALQPHRACLRQAGRRVRPGGSLPGSCLSGRRGGGVSREPQLNPRAPPCPPQAHHPQAPLPPLRHRPLAVPHTAQGARGWQGRRGVPGGAREAGGSGGAGGLRAGRAFGSAARRTCSGRVVPLPRASAGTRGCGACLYGPEPQPSHTQHPLAPLAGGQGGARGTRLPAGPRLARAQPARSGHAALQRPPLQAGRLLAGARARSSGLGPGGSAA